ncbi:MAG: heparinase II/III family protein [Pseudomonadota bacterium]
MTRSGALAALLLLGLGVLKLAGAESHPGLILTQPGVEKIKAQLGTVPLFDASLAAVKAEVDREMLAGIETPVPKDFSGGYTHQRHKQNFFIAQKAGLLFQILEDEKYAVYVRDMLLQYAAMYPDLPLHPQERSYARGKLFWQCLNDSNWLVYMSQAYDAIYSWLAEEERQKLENDLFRPFANFISIENPQFFNRIHNHSTWGNAAVGMIGLVMDDEELVQRALYGIKDDGLEAGARDNDGGFIKVAGQKAGFLANLEAPFSPDGYYTEGPYYQRYAMYPFLIFAQGLNNRRPGLEIFDHKDGVLLKAVDALLTLTDADGEFFPLNDGQKGMSYFSRELVTAVNIAYHVGDRNPQLLSVAAQQGQVLLDDAGFSVAAAVAAGKAQPLQKTSSNLSDGADGRRGGVAVLRHGNDQITLTFKYTAQGLSHGHYDKLSYSLYEQGAEVLQDYGLVRFVNIGQKGGGNYLPENTSWAKQSIAHNTVTRDATSHFEGKYEIGSQHHSELHFFSAEDPDLQVVSAKETHAYPGTRMQRTVALIADEGLERPLVLDIFRLESSAQHQFDLPFYFLGQVIDANFAYQAPSTLAPLGNAAGYQHLYLEGAGKPPVGASQLSWLQAGRFYTLTSATLSGDELLFTRIGANDPAFNLRRDAGFMIRRTAPDDTTFATIIESHGSYSPVSELALNSSSRIADLKVVFDDARYTAVSISRKDGKTRLFALSNQPSSKDQVHELNISGQTLRWSGPFQLSNPM